jgi:hypothetical protein
MNPNLFIFKKRQGKIYSEARAQLAHSGKLNGPIFTVDRSTFNSHLAGAYIQ